MDTKCTIRVFQFSGNEEHIKETLNTVGTPLTIHGPMIKQIAEAHSYVLSMLRAGLRVPSGFITAYKIPERAVKEAITNAVIHRDYHTKRDIEIKIFEDRVQIESPGLLPSNITPSNIGIERALEYRNDLLVKHLRDFPDPPNLDQSEGVKAMRAVMLNAELYPPIFVTYPTIRDGLRVSLLNELAPSEWDKISHLLNTQKYIKNEDARLALHIEDTIKVSKLLSRWVKQGLLTRIVPSSGSTKNTKYRLPSSDEKNIET
jgi:ATP-dependent DNA helicase RecG